MRRMLYCGFALLLSAGLMGCGEPDEDAEGAFELDATSPMDQEIEPTGTPMSENAAPAVSEAAAPTAEPEEALAEGDLHSRLVGTEWQLDDIYFEFRDEDTVFLRGGPIMNLAPSGMEAAYSYDDGDIEVVVAGQTQSGKWDGRRLTVEGEAAQRL